MRRVGKEGLYTRVVKTGKERKDVETAQQIRERLNYCPLTREQLDENFESSLDWFVD